VLQPAATGQSRPRTRAPVFSPKSFLRELESWRIEFAGDAVRAATSDVVDDSIVRSVEWFVMRSLMDAVLAQHRFAGEEWLDAIGDAVSAKRSRRGVTMPDVLSASFRRLDGHLGGDVFCCDCALLPVGLRPARVTAFLLALKGVGRECVSWLAHTGLGCVYESFLSRTLRLVDGRVTSIVGRGRRRASSAYFTPPSVIQCVLAQTVDVVSGPWTGAREVRARIVDPACGCGAFLVAAYERLVRRAALCVPGAVPEDTGACEHAAERILLDSISGVDIDSEAVAVTRFSLLCKAFDFSGWPATAAAADARGAAIGRGLSQAIRCGNAVVGSDVSQTADADFRAQRHELRAFDWAPAFPSIMRDGGFDVVVGNPPFQSAYSRESIRMPAWQKAYFARNYSTVSGRINMFVLFLERGLSLLRPGGRLGFVVPESFLMTAAYRKARDSVLAHGLKRVVLCGDRVFAGATVPACLLIVAKSMPDTPYGVEVECLGPAEARPRPFQRLSTETVLNDPEHRIHARVVPEIRAVLSRIREAGVSLETLAKVEDGVNPGPLRGRLVSSHATDARQLRLVEGRDIARYSPLSWRHHYLLWDEELVRDLRRQRSGSLAVLGCRERFLVQEKIVTRQTARGITGTLDRDGFCCTNSAHTTRLLDPGGPFRCAFLLGVLNSELASFYYRHHHGETTGAFPKVKVRKLRQLPVPRIDWACALDRERHDRVVALVCELLELHRELLEVGDVESERRLRADIRCADRAVDALVLSMYALSGREADIILGQAD